MTIHVTLVCDLYILAVVASHEDIVHQPIKADAGTHHIQHSCSYPWTSDFSAVGIHFVDMICSYAYTDISYKKLCSKIDEPYISN
jgi:hypothetical protein